MDTVAHNSKRAREVTRRKVKRSKSAYMGGLCRRMHEAAPQGRCCAEPLVLPIMVAAGWPKGIPVRSNVRAFEWRPAVSCEKEVSVSVFSNQCIPWEVNLDNVKTFLYDAPGVRRKRRN